MSQPAIEGSITDRVIVGRLELPSGGHVVLKDPTTLRAKDKKKVLKGIQDIEKQVAAGLDIVDGLICMLVESWDLPYLPNAPIPAVSIGMTDEMTIPDYDALVEAVGPAREVLFPGSPDVDKVDDPASPSGPASA